MRTPFLIDRGPGGAFWRYPDGREIPVLAGGDTIDRTGAEALIPEDVSREIIQSVPERSAVMQLARRLPNMTRKQQRMPVLAGLVTAGFVTGEALQTDNEAGRKPTSRMLWANKFIDAEEIAVIVPIPEAVLDDTDYDIWGEVRPRIEESIGAVFDAAVLYGTNAPAAWPDDILTSVTAAGHLVTEGSVGDLYDDIFNEGGVMSFVEEDGFDVTGHVASLKLRAKLRGMRDTAGQPLYASTPVTGGFRYALDGSEVIFPKNGAIDATESLLFSGDWDKLVYAIRQDLTFKILDQAVIQDTDGTILYNLAQQDMVALRAVIRIGWQVPNPLNRVNQNAATRYPFAVLSPSGT